jgi:hypothetical protein
MKRLLPSLLASLLAALFLASCAHESPKSLQDYHPDYKVLPGLPRAALWPLPLGCIKPKGWLERQLRTQADGLTGHLEEIWGDVGPTNAWRGGLGDGWERGPYYLDGLVPLAFELGDEKLLAKMQVWMDWNLGHPRADGGLGPNAPGDWWPDMVFLKALDQYGEASGDPRVLPALKRYADYLKANLPAHRLDAWQGRNRYDDQAAGAQDLVGVSNRWQYYRWMELVQDLLWLHQRTGEPWLLDFSREVKTEGYPWGEDFRHFQYTGKCRKDQIFLANHGVNNAMGIKACALDWLLDGTPQPLLGFDTLMKWHGQPNGAFGADEQLAGPGPIQGTELCTVVEEMYSLEVLMASCGEPRVGDALERLAYNALPAAFDEPMWTHQYDQQVNQVLVSIAPRPWTNNRDRANLFGLEPEWGCCTANYHQGWPKFVSHLWMATPDHGLAALSYAPCDLKAVLTDGKEVGLSVGGDYPFDGKVTLRLNLKQPAEFPLKLRIPGWAQGAKIRVEGRAQDARPGTFCVLSRVWKDEDTVQVELPMPMKAERWREDLVVNRGPLLMAMDLGYTKNVLGQNPWSDQERYPQKAWNLALLEKPGRLPDSALERHPVLAGVFDSATTPLVASLPARQVENWEMGLNVAGEIPRRPKLKGPTVQARLIPYGAAKLRVSVFPLVQ